MRVSRRRCHPTNWQRFGHPLGSTDASRRPMQGSARSVEYLLVNWSPRTLAIPPAGRVTAMSSRMVSGSRRVPAPSTGPHGTHCVSPTPSHYRNARGRASEMAFDLCQCTTSAVNHFVFKRRAYPEHASLKPTWQLLSSYDGIHLYSCVLSSLRKLFRFYATSAKSAATF